MFENYMMFNGTDGLYVYTFEYERKEDCLVCGQKPGQQRPSALLPAPEFVQLCAQLLQRVAHAHR